MMMKRIGSRAEVMHGSATMTEGGLMKKDLYLDPNDGRIKSKKAHAAAMARMKAEGKAHFVKVWKPKGVKKDGEVKLQAKEGSSEYDRKMKQFKRLQKKL
jgi:hypothetical protein